jgi:hypothetical protein
LFSIRNRSLAGLEQGLKQARHAARMCRLSQSLCDVSALTQRRTVARDMPTQATHEFRRKSWISRIKARRSRCPAGHSGTLQRTVGVDRQAVHASARGILLWNARASISGAQCIRSRNRIPATRVPTPVDLRKISFRLATFVKAPGAISISEPTDRGDFPHGRKLLGRVMPVRRNDGKEKIVGDSLQSKRY